MENLFVEYLLGSRGISLSDFPFPHPLSLMLFPLSQCTGRTITPVVIIHFCSCVKHLTRSASPPPLSKEYKLATGEPFWKPDKSEDSPLPPPPSTFSQNLLRLKRVVGIWGGRCIGGASPRIYQAHMTYG